VSSVFFFVALNLVLHNCNSALRETLRGLIDTFFFSFLVVVARWNGEFCGMFSISNLLGRGKSPPPPLEGCGILGGGVWSKVCGKYWSEAEGGFWFEGGGWILGGVVGLREEFFRVIGFLRRRDFPGGLAECLRMLPKS